MDKIIEKVLNDCKVVRYRATFIEVMETYKKELSKIVWYTGDTDIDGDFLCYIERKEECGNIWKYFSVIKNSFNTWSLKDGERVVGWTYLPTYPEPYKEEK
jgi:hypothetical protein